MADNAPAGSTPAAGTPNAAEPNASGNPAIGEGAGGIPATLPIAEKQPTNVNIEGPTPVAYEPTGDVGLDMALDFIGKFGISPDDPVMIAAGEGNFQLLEAKLAAMGDKAKGYEKFLALGKSSYETVQAKAKAESEAKATLIHNAVGGEERWKAIKEWAGKNAEPAEQTAVNAALNAGGLQAKAMAVYLDGLFDRAAGVVQVGKPAVNPNGAKGGAPNSGALSPRAYTAEVAKLSQKLGGRLDGSAEYRQLQSRRQAWKG